MKPRYEERVGTISWLLQTGVPSHIRNVILISFLPSLCTIPTRTLSCCSTILFSFSFFSAIPFSLSLSFFLLLCLLNIHRYEPSTHPPSFCQINPAPGLTNILLFFFLSGIIFFSVFSLILRLRFFSYPFSPFCVPTSGVAGYGIYIFGHWRQEKR